MRARERRRKIDGPGRKRGHFGVAKFIYLPDSNRALNADLVTLVQFTGSPEAPTATIYLQTSDKPESYSTVDTLALIKEVGLSEEDVRNNAVTPDRVAQRRADELKTFIE